MVAKLHTLPNCGGNVQGAFVEVGKCFREISTGAPTFSKVKCTPRNLVVETDCSKNCTTCFKTTLYARDVCLGGNVQYSCEKVKPSIDDTGYYMQLHFNSKCKIEDSEASLTFVIPRGFCTNSLFQKTSFFKNFPFNVENAGSLYHGYSAKNNLVKMTNYQKQGCKGTIVEEIRYGVGFCRPQNTKYVLFFRK
jgi:hypothetical protein